MFIIGLLVGVAACLGVNFVWPAPFAKLTRKAGSAVQKRL